MKTKVKLAQALNNVWVGDCRVWAREARFDRFAHNDLTFAKNQTDGRLDRGDAVKVVLRRDERVKQNLVGVTTLDQRVVKDLCLTVGSVEAPVESLRNNKKARRVEGRDGGMVRLRREEESLVKEGKGKVQQQAGGGASADLLKEGRKVGAQDTIRSQAYDGNFKFRPVYNSCVEDRKWANSGLVATVIAGESALSLQQRVKDAGFPNVVVIPLGGDWVFLNCFDGEDVWQVYNGAIEFFGMLFSNIHKWSVAEARYERGAWVRVYGVPVHAWNVEFFRLCVSGAGRYIHADECSVDKARLDYVCILLSTPNIDFINSTSEFLIDGRRFVIKLVEECGCNLGEDAFLMEVDVVSRPETLSQPINVVGMDEVQGEWELDDLVNDLHKEWSQHEGQKVGSHNSDEVLSINKDRVVNKEEFFEVQLSPVLQPLSNSKGDLVKNSVDGNIVEHAEKLKDSLTPGPLSIDWLANQKAIADGGIVFTSSLNKGKSGDVIVAGSQVPSSPSRTLHKHKKSGVVRQSVGFMKRIARMSAVDRKQILRMLKKQKRKRKGEVGALLSRATSNSNSLSSNNYNSSVNNDWENWAHLHGKAEGVAADVQSLGKAVGVNFQCETSNSFNLLTREGRRELRAASVGANVGGVKEGFGVVVGEG